MSTNAERFDRLRSFHLSEYAARAYLALLDVGEAEARDVSRLARIPLAKVYGVLEGLQAKGLCRIFPGTPKRYAPIPIRDYVARVVSEHKRASDALEAQADELAELFPVLGEGVKLSDRGRILALHGRRSAVEHESRVVSGADRELILMCTLGRLERMRRSLGELRAARDRGVQIRMMIPHTERWAKDVAAFSAFAEVRSRPAADRARGRGVSFVCNGTAGLMVDHIPDDTSVREGNDVGLYFATEGLVSALRDLLQHAWEHAPTDPPRGSARARAGS